jgi:hypothetical protein
MEALIRLLGSLLLFVYHCFDRVAINGNLSGLTRPGQVADFSMVLPAPRQSGGGSRQGWTMYRPHSFLRPMP